MLMLRVKQVTYEKKIYRQQKKTKAKRESARDLKNLCILPENSAEDLRSRRALLVSHLSMRMHPKNCHIFPLKVATTLLSGSRKGTTGV